MLKFRLDSKHKTKNILLNYSLPIGLADKIDLIGENPYINDKTYTYSLLNNVKKYNNISELDLTSNNDIVLDYDNFNNFVYSWFNLTNYTMLENYNIKDWLRDYYSGLIYMMNNSYDYTIYKNVFFNERQINLYNNLNYSDINFNNFKLNIDNIEYPEYSLMIGDYIINGDKSKYKSWVENRLNENIYSIIEAKKQYNYGLFDNILNIPDYNNCNSITDFYYFCCPIGDYKVSTNFNYIKKVLEWKIQKD